MAVDSYPRGPLSDLSPIITGKPGNIPFPCCWKRGGGGGEKKLARILQRWKFASHRQRGGLFSPVMCAILYKIIYDPRERAFFLGYRCEITCSVNSDRDTSRRETFLEKDFSSPGE